MRTYNEVLARAKCPSCGRPSDFSIHFRYGDTSRFRYRVGDLVSWGGNDVGVPGRKEAVVEGLAERCDGCRAGPVRFDVVLRLDVIAEVRPAPGRTEGVSRG